MAWAAPECREEPTHRAGPGHRAPDTARPGTARTDENVRREEVTLGAGAG